MKITTAYNQNIFDIAIERYGSAEAVFLLMADNPVAIANLDQVVAPGTKLKIDSAPADADMLKYIQGKQIQYASGDVTPAAPLLNVDDAPLLNITDDPILNISK